MKVMATAWPAVSYAQADAAQDVAPVVPQDLGDRVLDDLAAGRRSLFRDRGLGHLGADDQADDGQDDGQQERHAPGPGTGQVNRDQEDQVGQQQTDREAGLDDAGVLFEAAGRCSRNHQVLLPRPTAPKQAHENTDEAARSCRAQIPTVS
ncbi:MAG: hypothetical protein U0R72_14525 [Nakamurella multipartita]